MSAVHWHDFDRAHLRHAALRWAAAVLIILGAHAAIVYGALFLQPKAPAAAAMPPAAMMIELAPMSVTSPAEVEPMAPGPQSAEAEEVKDDTPEEMVEPPPEPEPEKIVEAPVEKAVEPEPQPTPELTPEPVQQAMAQEVTEPLTSPTLSEVVLPLPKPEELKKAEDEKPPSKPRRAEPEKRKKVERKREEPVKRHRQKKSTASTPPRSSAQQSRATAAPRAGASALSSAAIASWRARAFAHLMRFQRPMRGHQGRVVLYVSLSGSGAVRSARVIRSAGDSALDQQALAMVRRASPFPQPPGGQALNLSAVPIRFVDR